MVTLKEIFASNMEHMCHSTRHISLVCRIGAHRFSRRPGNSTQICASSTSSGILEDSTNTATSSTIVSDSNDNDMCPASIFQQQSVSGCDAISPLNLRSLQNPVGKFSSKQSKRRRRKDVETLTSPVDVTSSPVPPSTTSHRFNYLNIQMLPASLHRHLFGNAGETTATTQAAVQARKELHKRGLLRAPPSPIPDPELRLPRLRGSDVEEHFQALGEEQSGPYRELLHRFVAMPTPPPPPTEWQLRVGWTRYAPGESPRPIPFPSCDALVLDLEVCRAAGEAPVLATAASPDAWYCWVSPRLAAAAAGPAAAPPRRYSADDFLPLESEPGATNFASDVRDRPRVVVGHNVSYDRARVREQYWLERSALRFVDTMSLHVCVGGLASGQRAALRSTAAPAPEDFAWREVASLNSLADVHRLYCGTPLNKAARDLFINGQLAEVRADFQNATSYCAGDVAATWRVLATLLPMFLERFPHPVTLAGLLELGGAYLPVGAAWPRFLASAERAYDELRAESRRLLARTAEDACALLHDDSYRRDPWMWDQDWSLQELRLRKTVASKTSVAKQDIDQNSGKEEDFDIEEWPEKFRSLASTRHRLPKRRPLLPGYPAWYRSLCDRPGDEDWTPGPTRVSTGLQVTPKLLRLTWEGYPLHFVREHGWGFLVPREDAQEEEDEEVVEDEGPKPPLEELRVMCPLPGAAPVAVETDAAADVERVRREVQDRLGWASRRRGLDGADVPAWYSGAGVRCGAAVGRCWFLKLPHKDGAPRVGTPLAQDFLGAFEAGVLAGAGPDAARVLEVSRQLSYWRNNRERVLGQLVGWLPAAMLTRGLRGSDVGAIVPQVVAAGTLTRRAVEPTWMTAANARPGRLGSELRALVHAPPGHAFVGADVDSQELWIAAVLGDADSAGLHGATPFGWMTLSGTKADGTDMHSVTATAAGVSRDQAKVLNYARIYGAGPRFAQRLLQRFNPALGDAEARARATNMFTLTKGKRVWRPKAEWVAAAAAAGVKRVTSAAEARRVADTLGSDPDEVFDLPRWEGGMESAMFNRLEEIANAPAPATPFLGGRLSRALEAAAANAAAGADDRYLPTRVNWVVQSGAVDFLHLMLVCMRWLQPRARFCLSFHDEVRYLVTERERHRAALALHATNLLARSFCAHRLGLRDLPASVAFFASVEVDGALRKDAHHDCATPSNPHGLLRGYGVLPGESLDVYEAVKRAGGVLRAPRAAAALTTRQQERTQSDATADEK